MAEDTEEKKLLAGTRVWFNLWAVLGFLCLMAFLGFSHLNTTLSEGRAARIATDQAMMIRITKLEATYEYICQSLTELKMGQKNVEAILRNGKKTKE